MATKKSEKPKPPKNILFRDGGRVRVVEKKKIAEKAYPVTVYVRMKVYSDGAYEFSVAESIEDCFSRDDAKVVIAEYALQRISEAEKTTTFKYGE